MIYQIYSFGNGEILEGVFNSIAACLNSHSGSLYQTLKMLGLIFGSFWAIVYAVYGDFIKPLTHWILPMTIMTTLLFVPTATVKIIDPVVQFHQTVANVPYGLAAFASYVSKIGYEITKQVEKVFSLPDDLKYQKSGFLFASNILQQAKSFHITNQDMAENMRSFVGQCILYDAMLGRKYTIQDLRNSDDIWGLVSANASPVRSFLWREPKTAEGVVTRPEIVTCFDGVARFNRMWRQELDRSANLFGKKIFGKNGLINPKAALLQYLPLSYKALGEISKPAVEILKQQMMIYSVVDGIEASGAAVGNGPNFAARRAYLQQRSTYETLGAMAGETLPMMKAVLEAIAYGCFLFVIPLALLPFGYRFLFAWAQILLWLQMWAPLYAILNYIMTMAARSKTLNALSISNDAGVTIASSVGLANLNADISAMAGYLAMSIPFLCIALVKGVGSFVHMASHLGNVGQGAASMAAGELTSGNYSFGNISEGNVQISNSSMLQHSNAANYKGHTFGMQEGRVEMTTMADGSQVFNIGTSNLPVSLNLAESRSAQLSEMSSRSAQNALNLSESSAQNLASSTRNMVNLSESLARLENSGNTANLGVSTEQTQAIHKGKNLINEFAKQQGIETNKSAQMLANASFGNDKGGGLFGGSVSMGGSISASDQETYSKAQKFAQDHNFQDAMREAALASKQLSHSLSDETSKRLAEEVSGSYEQGMSQRSEASKSFRQAEDYSNQANYTKANSATINYNANQQFGEWLAAQPADNTNGRIGTRGAAHIMAHKPEETMAYAGRYMAEKGLNPANTISTAESKIKENYDQEQGYQVHAATKESLNKVRQEAGDLTDTTTQGPSTRKKVETQMNQDKEAIKNDSRGVAVHGTHLQQNVDSEQNKGVIRRVGAKGTKEIQETMSDIKKTFSGSGEAQQK